MKVFIVGYMCSGKSTIGKKLAKNMGLAFVDLDQYIEQKYKSTIAKLFETYDEALFRKLENEALAELLPREDVVIATGGGTPCFLDNMKLMKANGLTIFIEMHQNSLLQRICDSKRPRPLLAKIKEAELPAFIKLHLAERTSFYKQAQLTVKGENASIDQISKLIRETQFSKT
jgi:shikimate kinase